LRILTELTARWVECLRGDYEPIQYRECQEYLAWNRLVLGEENKEGEQVRFVTDATRPGLCRLVRRIGKAGAWTILEAINIYPKQLCLTVIALARHWHKIRQNRMANPSMDFMAAVQRLRSGHAVARESWSAGVYLLYESEQKSNPISLHGFLEGDCVWGTTQEDVLATDWYDLGPRVPEGPERTK